MNEPTKPTDVDMAVDLERNMHALQCASAFRMRLMDQICACRRALYAEERLRRIVINCEIAFDSVNLDEYENAMHRIHAIATGKDGE